jgi:energy-coupling factor transport system ATP-binding protein
MRAIEVNDLSFTYKGGTKKALDRIKFEQEQGEMVVLMGHTGAGKSTFSRCLNRLIPHFHKGNYSGEIRILGKSIIGKRVHDLVSQIGLVFQDFESQLFSTNVELEVAFGPENLFLPREEIRKRIREALELVRLNGFERRESTSLSGGEKQRLAIASILAIKPKIVVMDEPTTDLDPQGKLEIFSVAKLLKSEGYTILFIEHETEALLEVDKIVIMNAGKVVSEGKPYEILKDVQLLENHGIRPPQIAKLLKEINEPVLSLTVDETVQLFKKRDWELLDQRYTALLKKDEQRQLDYGNKIIEVNGLEYVYPGNIKALNSVGMEIREGEFLAIIGQNGSGKTTLVKHFNGLLKPSKGEVRVASEDTKGKHVWKLAKTVGYVFQNPDHQIFADTVEEEVAFGPGNLGISKENISRFVEEALKEVGLEGYERCDPFSLTKGERQRVAIASILAARPQVLILDEPTTGLDYRQQKSIMELLQNLNRKGHTIIIITHSLWVVAEYAKRVLVLHKGEIILDDSTRKVFSREEKLADSFLRLPEIIRLSNRMERTLLSVDEFKYCLER